MNTENTVKIIAEAGVNHNGCLERAFSLIDAAADAGADIVKFQSFRAEKLASKDSPKAAYQIENTGEKETQFEMLKRLELSEEDHLELIQHCKKRNIEFLSTPFDIDGLKMLVDQFELKTIKLGSSELTNGPILLAAARTGHKVILSTGMATLSEIAEALSVLSYGFVKKDTPSSRKALAEIMDDDEALNALAENVTLLHCTTAYPTPYDDVNLKAMQTIHATFNVPVGYSDHTLGIEVSIAAVAMGAQVIEKHFTLDRTLPGPDHAASLEPEELAAMVKSIRNIEQALGSDIKAPSNSEKNNMHMARKSLVAASDIEKNAVLTAENVTIKRPASGVSPMEYWDMLGTTARKAYKKDESFQHD